MTNTSLHSFISQISSKTKSSRSTLNKTTKLDSIYRLKRTHSNLNIISSTHHSNKNSGNSQLNKTNGQLSSSISNSSMVNQLSSIGILTRASLKAKKTMVSPAFESCVSK